MTRTKVALLSVALFLAISAAAIAAPATAAPAMAAPSASDAAFLASLQGAAPQAPAAPEGTVLPVSPMSCPPGFCAELRRECQAECAPCIGVSICIISICDGTCGCQC